uniref:JmjC domain-containing protein n=1 Tax=Panagrellus redivivus TaxID=6233 RepID=A0A7E4UPY4_PANRE
MEQPAQPVPGIGTPFVVRQVAREENYLPITFDLEQWLEHLTVGDPADEERKPGFDVRIGSRLQKAVASAIQYEKLCRTVKFHDRESARKWLTGRVSIYDSDYPEEEKFVSTGTHWGLFTCILGVRGIPGKRGQLSVANISHLEEDPDDQTIFIGTVGANIPCHYHSNGFDVHLVVSGSERWILFPPNDNNEKNPPPDLMKPSRFPFELSTVYSRHNVVGGCIPNNLVPYEVELSAGDLLYIPAKWWRCFVVTKPGPNAKKQYAISITANCNRKLQQDSPHPNATDNKEPTLWTIMDPLQKAFTAKFKTAFNDANIGPQITTSVDMAEQEASLDEVAILDEEGQLPPPSPTQDEALDTFFTNIGEPKELLIQWDVPVLNQVLSQSIPISPEHSGNIDQLTVDHFSWKRPYIIGPFTTQMHDVWDAFGHSSTVRHVNQLLHPNFH